jgi:hypothetical protein
MTCFHLKVSRSRVFLLCAVAGAELGVTGLLIDATGYFNCDNRFESCTLQWAFFWIVLVLPWLVATLLLARSRSITLFSCVLLGLSLSLGFGAWVILSAAANLDHDIAQDDLFEATFGAVAWLILGTPIVSIATGVVGLVLQSVLPRVPVLKT